MAKRALIILALLAVPRTALAHKLNVFAHVEGATIRGKVYFSGGSPAQNVRVTAFDPAGGTLGRSETDATGNFALEAHRRTDYRLLAQTEDGHGAEYTIHAAELPESLSPTSEGVARAPLAPSVPAQGTGEASGTRPIGEGEKGTVPICAEHPPGRSGKWGLSTFSPPAPAPAAANPDVIAEIKALDAQVIALREQLDGYENRIRLRDLLGGVGFILGLAGVVCYMLSQRGKR
jgi:nickel transport protein